MQNSHHVSLKIKEGESFFHKGELAKAEQRFASVLAVDPKNTEAYNNLGVVAYKNGDMQRAWLYLTRSIQWDPYNKDAIINLADILIERDLPAGRYTVTWDGRNTSGERVSSGMYFFRLQADGTVDTKKTVLMK